MRALAKILPRRLPSYALVGPLRRSLAVAAVLLLTLGSYGASLAAVSISTSFIGVRLAESGYIPPNPSGAACTTQYLVATNGRIPTFTKFGVLDGALNTDTDTFFDTVRNNSPTTYPRVAYDQLSSRWFVVMTNVSTPNRILVAVSSGSTIAAPSSFTFFQFQHDLVGTTPNANTGGFADFPTLGVDANALYIGVNVYSASGTAFLGTTGFVIKKSSLLLGQLVVAAFRQLAAGTGAGPFAPQGVTNLDPGATEGYFIGADSASFGALMLRRVTDPGGTPSISGNLIVTVPSTRYPANIPAKGSTRPLDGLDDRLSQATIVNGSLWTAHAIGLDNNGVASTTPTRDGVRWYQISNLGSTPTLQSSGTIFDPAATAPKFYWVPSIMVSRQGHAALGMSFAGTLDNAGAAVSSKLSTEVGFGNPTYLPSTSAYNVQTSSTQRWGAYSSTSLDPCDGQTMWTAQEIADATNSWGVLIVKLQAPPPATPASLNVASITIGTSATAVLTGTSASGSGFFDPGPGFACRLSVSMSHGVTASAVFVNPTTLQLQLDATNATPGPTTITVINPDGQSATSASTLLNVVAGTVSPTVTAVTPANGATAVSRAVAPTATFSRAMDATTITASSFTLSPASGNTVAATVGYDGSTNIATVTPASMLAVGTTYTASLATTIKADDGMALASPFSWSFTTEADAIPPTITAPADVAVTTSSGTCAASPGLGTATASDNSGTVTVTNNAPAIFPEGTTSVTWTATDPAGNTAIAVQHVTVADAESPALSAPPSLSRMTGPSSTQAGVVIAQADLGTATATDNCPGSVSIGRSGVPTGNFFPIGMTALTHIASGRFGNTATATQQVTVLDNTRPRITALPTVST